MKVLPCVEVAYVLRQALGPLQAWQDLLADFRTGKRSEYSGARLMPIGRCGQTPVYRPADVSAFIDAVHLRHGRTPGDHRPLTIEVEPPPPGTGSLYWASRKLGKATRPS